MATSPAAGTWSTTSRRSPVSTVRGDPRHLELECHHIDHDKDAAGDERPSGEPELPRALASPTERANEPAGATEFEDGVGDPVGYENLPLGSERHSQRLAHIVFVVLCQDEAVKRDEGGAALGVQRRCCEYEPGGGEHMRG